MSFDTDWDIEKYYNPLEPPDHWKLRKKFMEVNKTKYPEQRLITLAATFLNVEALGCSYNSKVMQLIEELSKGVVEEYREQKKLKAQKVFVKASDAAASKVKGQATTSTTREQAMTSTIREQATTSTTCDQATTSTSCEQNVAAAPALTDSCIEIDEGPAYMTNESIIEISDESREVEGDLHFEQGNKGAKRKKAPKKAGKKMKKKFQKILGKKIEISEESQSPGIPAECCTSYGNMVLIRDDGVNVVPRQIIERSASLCRAKITVQEQRSQGSNMTTVRIFIRGMEVATATDTAKKKATELAYQLALKKLQEECYTIKVKRRRYDHLVGKNFGESDMNVGVGVDADVDVETQKEEPQCVPCSGSIALKMMANMGWTGGGLGKAQQGITEPISLAVRVNRSGLGIKPKEGKKGTSEKPETAFQKKALAYLEAYAKSTTEQDLVFTTEFDSDERKILHSLAGRLDLKSKSHGKKAKRHLVISRKLEPFSIIKTLLKPGYASQKYELLKPTCSQ